jgi:hypothetical protein
VNVSLKIEAEIIFDKIACGSGLIPLFQGTITAIRGGDLMPQPTKFANIPQETVAAISELERQIKQSTLQDVVCIVYEKA